MNRKATRRYDVNHRHRWCLLALQLGAVAALFGCAEQQPPVNRVEAYALSKTLFTGEWYYQQTVVDTPGTKTVTFEGETAFMGTHRIRWDIQESYLYARASYEKVVGAKNMSQDTGEYLGEIVGAWRIVNHFDIKAIAIDKVIKNIPRIEHTQPIKGAITWQTRL